MALRSTVGGRLPRPSLRSVHLVGWRARRLKRSHRRGAPVRRKAIGRHPQRVMAAGLATLLQNGDGSSVDGISGRRHALLLRGTARWQRSFDRVGSRCCFVECLRIRRGPDTVTRDAACIVRRFEASPSREADGNEAGATPRALSFQSEAKASRGIRATPPATGESSEPLAIARKGDRFARRRRGIVWVERGT